MLCVVTPEQESVSIVTSKMTATVVTPESGLVLEDILMTSIRVETRLYTEEITTANTSKSWGTSWLSDHGKELIMKREC